MRRILLRGLMWKWGCVPTVPSLYSNRRLTGLYATSTANRMTVATTMPKTDVTYDAVPSSDADLLARDSLSDFDCFRRANTEEPQNTHTHKHTWTSVARKRKRILEDVSVVHKVSRVQSELEISKFLYDPTEHDRQKYQDCYGQYRYTSIGPTKKWTAISGPSLYR